MIAQTATQRKRKERAAHKAAGRVPVTVQVLPDYTPEVRELEAKLQRREGRKKPNVRSEAETTALPD